MSQLVNFSDLQTVSNVSTASQLLLRLNNSLSGAAGFARTDVLKFQNSLPLYQSLSGFTNSGRTIGMTGDVNWTTPAFNGSANVTAVGTLSSTGVSAGTYGSSTTYPIFNVDAKGRILSAGNIPVSPLRVAYPSILSAADVWFRSDSLVYPNAGRAGAWPNSGTTGTSVTASSATPLLQPIIRREGPDSSAYADFSGSTAFQASIPRSYPATFYTVVKTGFPTAAAMCPWSVYGDAPLLTQQTTGVPGSWILSDYINPAIALPNTVRTAGEWFVIKCVVNGLSSSLSINSDPLATASGYLNCAPATMRFLGSYSSGANYCQTAVKEHIEFSGVLSPSNDSAVMNWLNSNYVKTSQLICDGSSITQGTLATPDSDWPSQILPLLTGNWTVHNLGVGGQSLADMVSDASTQIDAKINRTAAYKIVVAEAPTNSIFLATGNNAPYVGATAASIYSDYQNYCLARRAAGYQVITTTIMPRTGGGTPAGFEAMRLTFNALVRNGANSFSDLLVDIAADPRFQNPADTTYFADTVHLTFTGLGIFAQYIANAVNNLTNIPARKELGAVATSFGNTALVAGSATVIDTRILTNSIVIPARKTASGSIGTLTYSVSSGIGFGLVSTSNTETSTISYQVNY
jgi:hypothetical protein